MAVPMYTPEMYYESYMAYSLKITKASSLDLLSLNSRKIWTFISQVLTVSTMGSCIQMVSHF